jgi:hypothetical protein
VDDVPWQQTFGELATDAVFSPNGNRVACTVKENGRWTVAVDGKSWPETYDMLWQPVFSPDSQKVAAKAEKKGRYVILVDGRPVSEESRMTWSPIFSPDSQKILVRAIEDGSEPGRYCRHVLPLSAS